MSNPRARLCPRHSWSVCAWTGRLPAMTASTQSDSLLAARERWVARGVSAPAIVAVRRGRRARRGRRRRPLPGLRRRHRLPEPRPQPRGRRPRDPRAGRPVPAPVLHGRGLRALRGRLPQARRAVPLPRRRPEEHPLQLRRGGGRERRQDRARQDRPAGDRRLRPRLPRPHADDDDADVARSSRTRRASGRSRRRSTARRRRTRTAAISQRRLDRGARAAVPRARRSGAPSRP